MILHLNLLVKIPKCKLGGGSNKEKIDKFTLFFFNGLVLPKSEIVI